MPYRDLPLASPGPAPLALRSAAVLVAIQGIGSLLLALAFRLVGKAAEAEVTANAVAFEHGLPRYDVYWASVLKSPFWTFAPWSFVGLVLVASTLVALRARAEARWLGAVGVGLGIASVASLAGPILLGARGVTTSLVASALMLLAAVSVLWAVSRPGARLLVWLATAAASAEVIVALAPVRTLFTWETASVSGGMLSRATVAHGEQVGFLLSLVGFATVAVAALVRRPEDARGPAPASPMGRATAAMLLATLPPSGLAIFRGAIAAWDSSWTQQGCIFVLQKLARMPDFRYVVDWFVGFTIVATIGVLAAARMLAPRFAAVVGAMAAIQTGLGFLVMSQSPALFPAWALCACALVAAATVLVQSARQRTLDDAARLAIEDTSGIVDRTSRTSAALVACSVPAIGALLVAVATDVLDGSRGLGLGGGFLGVATAFLALRAARSYRRSASAFSELARLTRASSDRHDG